MRGMLRNELGNEKPCVCIVLEFKVQGGMGKHLELWSAAGALIPYFGIAALPAVQSMSLRRA